MNLLLITLLLISVVVNIILSRKIFKLLSLIEAFNTFVFTMKSTFEEANKRLNVIDKNGAFSSDDEVGFAFNVMKDVFYDVEKFIDNVWGNKTDKETK